MIWGVDVNLREVNAVSLPGLTFVRWAVSKNTPSLECAREIAHEIRTMPEVITGDDVVWIERPSGRFIKAVADLSRVMGGFVAALPVETSIEEVVPAEWKKLVGLPGNAGKQAIMEWATLELARRGWLAAYGLTEHQADALAIAVACERESARYTETDTGAIA